MPFALTKSQEYLECVNIPHPHLEGHRAANPQTQSIDAFVAARKDFRLRGQADRNSSESQQTLAHTMLACNLFNVAGQVISGSEVFEVVKRTFTNL